MQPVTVSKLGKISFVLYKEIKKSYSLTSVQMLHAVERLCHSAPSRRQRPFEAGGSTHLPSPAHISAVLILTMGIIVLY